MPRRTVFCETFASCATRATDPRSCPRDAQRDFDKQAEKQKADLDPRDAQRAVPKPQKWLQIVLRSIRGLGTGVILLPGR